MGDLLAAIAKKRKEREEFVNVVPVQKKYLTRKEIEAAQLEKIEQERKKAEEEKNRKRETEMKSKQAGASQQREGEQRNKSTNSNDNNTENSENKESPSDSGQEKQAGDQVEQRPSLPKSEVIRRLRARGEPITYFGETDLKREQRLRHLEVQDPEGEDRTEFGRNDFALAMDEIEEQTEGEEKGEQVQISREELDDFAIPYTQEPKTDEEICLFFFYKLLKEWEQTLNDPPDPVKKSAQGKIATATMKQTQKYIRPLFRLLKNKTIPEDILKALVRIVHHCKNERNYIKANDEYLRLAIGNAPWPMGVTMVGIHERSAREKIFSKQVAHILNDETQRKYIQSVKRLMTFCQKKYPANPPRCVG